MDYMDNKYKNFDWESVGFNFGNWEEELVWALDLPVEDIDVSLLLWHFDIPYWENDARQRWRVTPRDVINQEKGTLRELEKVNKCDTNYPIDLYKYNEKFFVLDGLHRLVKLYQQGKKGVHVRIVPKERFVEVASKHPFELPNQELK